MVRDHQIDPQALQIGNLFLGGNAVIDGIGVGYSAGYSWQTVFNTFGALSIAGSLFGVKTAIALRIGTNVAGALYAFLSWQILSRLLPWIFCEKDHTSLTISSK